MNIIQPDISHAGGISDLRRIATIAEVYDVALAPRSSLGPIALATSLHVDVVSADFAIQEMSVGIHYHAGSEDLLSYVKNPGGWNVHEGYSKMMEGPGMGIEINENKVRELSIDAKPWVNT